MNLALVNDTFNRFFAEPGESELKEPTPAEIEQMRQGVEDLKRRLREVTPIDWHHPIQPGHDDI